MAGIQVTETFQPCNQQPLMIELQPTTWMIEV